MPGSPVMYYGDEIGMGDNIYLGDRDGVRTPMQWNPDRNAGFSSADFARLFLPPLMDPVYGFQAVNVEAQQRDPSSFLQWIRRMLLVRKQHPVLAVGRLEMLHAQNPSVLAYLRRGLGDHGGEDIVLCVNNLSRFPQPCELMLEQLDGKLPIELTGRVPFPPVGELPYFVTLPPHGFYWFELIDQVSEERPHAGPPTPVAGTDVPGVTTVRGGAQGMVGRGRGADR
jgi:maltose alpha-D-glucosyltransferase/alpha-amylase